MADLIHRFNSVGLQDIVRSGSPWKKGTLRIRYVDYTVSNKDAEWDSFQAYKNVFGVIGIGDCEEEDNLTEMKAKFELICKSFPPSATTLLFGVNPSENTMASLSSLQPNDVILIPGADVLEASPERRSMCLYSHLQQFVQNIVETLERWTLGSDNLGAYVQIPTDKRVVNRTEVDNLKKWKDHRVKKLRGDWCVQAAQYKQALTFYNEAIEKAKSENDWVWVGGAYEGQIVAMLCDRDRTLSQCFADVRNTFSEAITYYNKQNVTFLELIIQIRYARYLGQVGQKDAASDNLTQVARRASAALGLSISPERRISLFGEIAEAYHDMGFKKKSAFYIRVIADFYSKLQPPEPSNAFAALRLCAPVYGLSGFFDHSENSSSPYFPPRRGVWTSLQTALMRNAVDVCKQMHDPSRVALYAHHMLSSYKDFLSLSMQQKLASDILWATSLTDRPLSLIGRVLPIPTVVSVRPLTFANNSQPKAPKAVLDKQRSAAASIFLYNPLNNKKKKNEPAAITWVSGELCHVDVVIENPLAVPVTVDRIDLTTRANEGDSKAPSIKCFFQSLTLLPQQRSTCVGVLCRVSGVGELIIDECIVEALGVRSAVKIDSFGNPRPSETLFHSSRTQSSNCPPAAPAAAAAADTAAPQSPTKKKTQDNDDVVLGRTITVLDPMPVLDVFEVTSHTPTKMTLLQNQVVDYEVELRNSGNVPIRSLDVSFMPKPNFNSYDFQRKGGRDDVLPILPGEKRSLMLHIMAKKHVAVNEVHFVYSSSPPEAVGTDGEAYSRDFLLPISTSVHDSVSLSRVDASILAEDERYCRVSFVLQNISPHFISVKCEMDDTIVEAGKENDVFIKDSLTLRPNETGMIVIQRARMIPREEELQTVAFFPDNYRNGHFVNPEDLVSEHNVNRPESLPVRLTKDSISAFFDHIHLTWKTLPGERKGVLPFDQPDLLSSDAIRALYVSPISIELTDDLVDARKDAIGRSIIQPLHPVKVFAKATSVFSQMIADPLHMSFSVSCTPSGQNKDSCYAIHGTHNRTFDNLPPRESLGHSITLIALPSSTPNTTITVTVTLVGVWGKVFTVSKQYCLQTQ